jgi:hypothetical protein
MSRIVTRNFAAVVVIVGATLLLCGLGLALLFGPDDTLDQGSHRLPDGVGAATSHLVTTTTDGHIGPVDFRPTVTITVAPDAGSGPVLVGVAPSSAVDRFLSGRSVARVNGESPFDNRLDAELTYGDLRTPAIPPPTFWTTSVIGDRTAELTWALSPGKDDVVVLSTTGEPLHASVHVELTAPHAFAAATLTAATGAGLMLLTLWWMRRSRRTTALDPLPEHRVSVPA